MIGCGRQWLFSNTLTRSSWRTRGAATAANRSRMTDSDTDTDPVRHDLTGEAIRLTRLARALLPDDGEVARRPARVSAGGELVALDEQDCGGLGRGADRRRPPPRARRLAAAAAGVAPGR